MVAEVQLVAGEVVVQLLGTQLEEVEHLMRGSTQQCKAD